MEDHETYSPKEKYRRMFDDAIGQRMGSMALWRVLDEIGFFTSPASTKYHLSVPGGLLQHSINVAEAAMELCETPRFKTCDKRAVFVAALLHDVCKAGKYIEKPGGGYAENNLGRTSIKLRKPVRSWTRRAFRYSVGTVKVMPTICVDGVSVMVKVRTPCLSSLLDTVTSSVERPCIMQYFCFTAASARCTF